MVLAERLRLSSAARLSGRAQRCARSPRRNNTRGGKACAWRTVWAPGAVGRSGVFQQGAAGSCVAAYRALAPGPSAATHLQPTGWSPSERYSALHDEFVMTGTVLRD